MSQSSAAPKREELTVRLRPDLLSTSEGSAGVLTVKDPVASRFFRFAGAERSLLRFLEQSLTTTELHARARQLPGYEQIELAEVRAFVTRLVQDGLLLVEAFGQGRRRLALERSRRWLKRVTRGLGFLSIRIPGPDPTPLLRRVQPIGDRFFSSFGIALTLVVSAFVGLNALLRITEISRRMPTISAFLTIENLAVLSVVVVLVKVLHELGHATACRKFGGECRDAGVMLLVFIPCLYCDVSDAWLFPKRSHRLLVSAAGILVELAIASTAALVWYFTIPGALNSICFNLAVACSVNTLLINGNPLMRFDGYFLATDLMNRPNLSTEASRALWQPVTSFVDRTRRLSFSKWVTQPGLVSYGAASWVYRGTIMVAIAWGISKSLHQAGLDLIAHLFLVMFAAGITVPILMATHSAAQGMMRGRYSSWRIGFLAALLMLSVVFLSNLRVPYPVRVPAMLELGGAVPIHAPRSGVFQRQRELGAQVLEGDRLATIEDPVAERRLLEIEGRLATQQLKVETLETRRVGDPAAAAMLPVEQTILREFQTQQKLLQDDLARLQILAPRSGQLTIRQRRRLATETDVLSSWTGSVWDRSNQGCAVEVGDEIGWIGDPQALEVLCYVAENQVRDFAIGRSVRIRLHQHPGQTFDGTVVGIEAADIQDLPSNLVAAGMLATRPNNDGLHQEAPLNVTYRVRVVPRDLPAGATHGSLGYLKVVVTDRTLGGWIGQWIGDAVKFQY